MKLLVPVYDLSYANAVRAAAQAGGHIVAIANPDSGPGRSGAVAGWKTAIKNLRNAGAQVLYYVDLVQWDGDQGISVPGSGKKEKAEPTLKAEMDAYISRYGVPVGWFFDDLWDHTPGRASRLKKLVEYKPGLTVANPGAGVSELYLATGVNVLVTWETKNYPTSQPAAWEAANPSRVGAMAMKQNAFGPAHNVAKQRNISLFYATNATDDGQAYDQLPPYFAQMAAAV